MTRTGVIATLVASMALAGCSSSFTGLSGSISDFKCKAPEGVACTSVSGVYANSVAGNIPGMEQSSPASKKDASGKASAQPIPDYAGNTGVKGKFSPRALTAPNSGDPIRIPPLVLRVWIAPWEDSDGDLHDQDYFYTIIANGRWMIEANREHIRDQFKPLYPLKSKSNKAAESAETPLNPEAEAEATVSAAVAQTNGMPK